MSVMILDAGNSLIKAKIARRENGEVSFPHVLTPLTESEYKRIVERNGDMRAAEDYLRVNGKPYVVGASAERHGVITQRSGAARYTRDYYGILAVAALARLYPQSRDIRIFGSHAPGDVGFRMDLMKSVVGEWEVENAGRFRQFRITYANTFDEPVGGLMNVLLTEDGRHYQHSSLTDGRALVIDIGGFTTDWLAVNPGGEVDYSLARSVPIGIQSVLTNFEDSFRANHLDLVKDTPVLPAARVRQALATRVFEGAGKKIDCSTEVQEAISLLLNRLTDMYQKLAGGSLAWDTIILTGGGSAVMHTHLTPLLNHDRVMLADDLTSLHMANVRGGLKLWRLYETLEIV